MQPEEVSAGGDATFKIAGDVPGLVSAASQAINTASAATGGYGVAMALLALSAQAAATLQKSSDAAAEQGKALHESAQQKIDVEALNRGTLARVQQGMESGAAANTYRS